MNRKSIFLSLLVSAFCFASLQNVQAQNENARMGIKGGLNISNLYVDDVDDENARIGFHVGFYGQVLASETFALQPELLFTTKGAEAEFDGLIDQTVRFNLNYLELPVLAVFKLGQSAEIHAGAYAGYLLNANLDYSGDISNGGENLDRDNFNSMDYGLVGGFALNFGAFQIGTRYNFGLAKIAKDDDAESFLGNSKNSNAQVFIAFNFNQ